MRKIFSVSNYYLLFSAGLAALTTAFFTPQVRATNDLISEELSNQCSTIDLRHQFPLKMRHQGDVSWCYAHAAADLLQFYFKIPEQISAADIALQYNKKWFPQLLNILQGGYVPEYGFAQAALNSALEQGHCPEQVLPTTAWIKISDQGEELIHLNLALEQLSFLQRQVKTHKIRSSEELPFYFKFENLSKLAFFNLIKNNPQNSQATKLLAQMKQKICQSSRKSFPVNSKNIRATMIFKGHHIFEKINRELQDGRPLTVDFFAGVLNNIDRFKIGIKELHTTLLMGRRWDQEQKKCTYLLKNSYGTSCSEYDPRLNCEGGYLWIPANALKKAMTSIVYLKKN